MLNIVQAGADYSAIHSDMIKKARRESENCMYSPMGFGFQVLCCQDYST